MSVLTKPKQVLLTKPPGTGVTSSALQQERLLQNYHALIDKRLSRTLSNSERIELEELEKTLEAMEETETSEMMGSLEQQHLETMQMLGELTAELRRLGSVNNSRTQRQ